MSEEISNQNSGDAGGNLTVPEDILPLFFTSKTQQIFGCIADEDVTAENPHKLILKETILQDFKDRAAVSDFHPAKTIVLVSRCFNEMTTNLTSVHQMYMNE